MRLSRYACSQGYAISRLKVNQESISGRRAALEQNTARELQSLSQLISAEQRRHLLRKLFAGDAQRLEVLCAQLEAAPA